MLLIAVVAALALLALLTRLGTLRIERRYPPQGEIVRVDGGRLHVVDLGPHGLDEPPIVLLHGASSNLGAMRVPLGEMLAQRHRVILIDRPGHGWSTREARVAPPDVQARMISQLLDRLGIPRAIFVVHSMAGAMGARLALDQPDRVAGLVMLAAATHPWPGGSVGRLNDVMTTPVIGPLLAYTITLPLGLMLADPGARAVFAPQTMPENYIDATATPLLLRPRNFLANSWDLIGLNAALTEQVGRYAQIKAPTVVIHGDADSTASLSVHSRPFAAEVPGAKLIVLPHVGHMVQNAAPELVVREIEGLIARLDTKAPSTIE
ncbi:alpha/beta fold hydrolase [Rhodopseudomonas sp. B29]|uniref:alpha/beta fold hydrolase n=1 Tax=Rhodopseudomonas sp. B29 TaxID=95607 RepID=UPI0003476A18|nr:alpha/beta hydrolase [Rhodopseudomonas sp. B29]